jgi:SAM-dependent methyltransferase
MSEKKPDEIRTVVRKRYSEIAKLSSEGGCCTPSLSCCDDPLGSSADLPCALGYSQEEMRSVPDGADMGLGCGNPQAIAALKQGEVVLDLGSGGGFDCFLAAKQVGETGKVIGVDMTADMVTKASENARKGGFKNVEFRLGEIEHLPVANESVDVIISNCVINLSPQKLHVFREAYRILRPGGRLAITDVLSSAPLLPEMKNDPDLLSACVGGAVTVEEIETMLLGAGFQNIEILPMDESRMFIKEWVRGMDAAEYVVSATIKATKPAN